MAWITLPFSFPGNRWLISWLRADFAAIVDALNAFNPSGAPFGPSGAPTVRNLIGAFNAVTPATKYDLSCGLVVLRNPSNGSLMTQEAILTQTNDVALAGPVINGRDQAAVFTPSSWIHFYFIGNPTAFATATISSLTAPTTGLGPSLPSGYTAWAYAGAVRFDGGSALVPTLMRGAGMYYPSALNVVNTNATVINTETTVNVAAQIPPNATEFTMTQELVVANLADTEAILVTRVITGANQATLRGFVSGSLAAGSLQAQLTVPNVGQNYFYFWNMTVPSSPVLTQTIHDINGYRVSNGDA